MVSMVSTNRLPEALCVPKAKFPPDHSRSQGAFGLDVGGFHAFPIDEGPEIRAALPQLIAAARETTVAAEDSAQQ